MREFVGACSVCAHGKSSYRPSAGLLYPVPHCPRSHIAVDFVTSLPPSQGNATILNIVDWFSKTVHFIPLLKLLCTMYFVSEAPSCPHRCVCLSVRHWGQQPVSPPGTTPNQMARQSGLIKTLKLHTIGILFHRSI